MHKIDLLLPPAKLLCFDRTSLDERGYTVPTLTTSIFEDFGFRKIRMVESYTEKIYTLRGLHFQPSPYQEQRLLRVLKGKIQFCLVNINEKSSDFGNYELGYLDDTKCEYLFVPIHFLHGYITLRDDVVIQYFFDVDYHPEIRTGIKWDDPDLAIPWIAQPEVVGKADQNFPSFRDMFPIDS